MISVKKEKHIPKRMCVACREMKEKNELFKVVYKESAVIDESGKLPGRGAYVCKNMKCITLAEKKGGFQRAFKVNCSDIYESLRAECEKCEAK